MIEIHPTPTVEYCHWKWWHVPWKFQTIKWTTSLIPFRYSLNLTWFHCSFDVVKFDLVKFWCKVCKIQTKFHASECTANQFLYKFIRRIRLDYTDIDRYIIFFIYINLYVHRYKFNISDAGASFEGGWGAVAPQGKRKKKKRKKKRKKERKKREKRKKGTMNNVKFLHIKCRFFQIFNSPVALENKKKLGPPKKKLKWRHWSDDDFKNKEYFKIWMTKPGVSSPSSIITYQFMSLSEIESNSNPIIYMRTIVAITALGYRINLIKRIRSLDLATDELHNIPFINGQLSIIRIIFNNLIAYGRLCARLR